MVSHWIQPQFAFLDLRPKQMNPNFPVSNHTGHAFMRFGRWNCDGFTYFIADAADAGSPGQLMPARLGPFTMS
jgi:hypothetical protein